MASVTVTELKAHLADYLRRVRDGERFHVTSHGREVADLVPPDPVRAALWHMVETGEATGREKTWSFPTICPSTPVAYYRTSSSKTAGRTGTIPTLMPSRVPSDRLPRHQRLREAHAR